MNNINFQESEIKVRNIDNGLLIEIEDEYMLYIDLFKHIQQTALSTKHMLYDYVMKLKKTKELLDYYENYEKKKGFFMNTKDSYKSKIIKNSKELIKIEECINNQIRTIDFLVKSSIGLYRHANNELRKSPSLSVIENIESYGIDYFKKAFELALECEKVNLEEVGNLSVMHILLK